MFPIFNNGDRKFFEVPKEVASVDAVMRVKKVPCHYVEIEGEEVQELSSWLLIQHDLRKVIDTFEMILKLEEPESDRIIVADQTDPRGIVKTSLFSSAIITYGKCFNEARGRVVRLRVGDIFGRQHRNALKTHKEMISIRNKYVAHGDKSHHEEVIVRVALNPDLGDKKIITTYYFVKSTTVLGSEKIKEFLDVVYILEEFVKARVSDSLDKIRPQLREMPIETLYEKATYLNEDFNFTNPK